VPSSRPVVDVRPSASEAGDTQADDSERQKRKRTQNWKGKAEVLEQVNELISELDGIASSIASQVCQPPAIFVCLSKFCGLLLPCGSLSRCCSFS
jgi:hypothetical protein